ncbi:follicle-stimulating hormone receptor-like [Eleginops maclovinus]|uniref:follicle-stimulating hormone receptor-like n=1 Tax=Eleginops maclovinus TaxID=56733 RepID=UPI00307FD351
MILIMFVIVIMMRVSAPCTKIEQELFGITEIPSNISSSTECLYVKQRQITVIPRGTFSRLQNLKRLFITGNDMLENISAFAFARLPLLTEIYISDNGALRSIGDSAFSDLPELTGIQIINSKHLIHIHPDAFKNIGKLRGLIISNTGLTIFPNFTKIHSTAKGFVLYVSTLKLTKNAHTLLFPHVIEKVGCCMHTELNMPRRNHTI